MKSDLDHIQEKAEAFERPAEAELRQALKEIEDVMDKYGVGIGSETLSPLLLYKKVEGTYYELDMFTERYR